MGALTNPLARVIPSAQMRWQSSMAAFAAADREQQPAHDGVLFVGSSTIRMWNHLPQDFRQAPVVINRGFGGSTMADCHYFVQQLVVQYKPRQVLVYAGDNDLAVGRTPAQVLASFQGFVKTVRRARPDTVIDYISIKPSPSRIALMPQIRETNALLAAYIKTLPDAQYIDVFSKMVDAQGAPREELFRSDRLHMNDEGYTLWRSVISSYVLPPEGGGALEAHAPAAATVSAAGSARP
ncbi:SGNH/GDSL hydrolase family protein [Xylophilus sp. GW821-FHT01B05]